MCYDTEKALFEDLLMSDYVKRLKVKYNDNLSTLIEPKGLFGIPDLVFVIYSNKKKLKYSIAFELKLKNWKRALQQAFKYKSFSEKSYVIIDHKFINPPLKNIDLFKKSNIGLLSLENGHIQKHFIPKKDKPYSKPLSQILFEN